MYNYNVWRYYLWSGHFPDATRPWRENKYVIISIWNMVNTPIRWDKINQSDQWKRDCSFIQSWFDIASLTVNLSGRSGFDKTDWLRIPTLIN